MRTTIDIPEDLIKNAMKVSHSKTKTRVIIMALEDFIKHKSFEELRSLRGKLNLNVDINKSRDRS